MLVVTAKHLRALNAQLQRFVDPDNPEGFFRTFVIWVVRNWRKANFYATEERDLGHDRSRFPVATDSKLGERITFYREFINANTGVSLYTFKPDMGMDCETFEHRLQKLYGKECSRQIATFVSHHDLLLPETMDSTGVKNVTEAILLEAFDYRTTPELARISDDILMQFSQQGWALTPYTCPTTGPAEYNDNHFGAWTLQDFKKAMLV